MQLVVLSLQIQSGSFLEAMELAIQVDVLYSRSATIPE